MDKLVEALKEKYRRPQDALLALGLDAALIEEMSMDKPKITRPGANLLSPAAMVARAALFTYLRPRLAADSRKGFDFTRLVQGVTSKNYAQANDVIMDRVITSTKGKLAQDADIQDLAALLNALKPDAEIADQTAMPPGAPPPPAAMPTGAPDAEPTDTVAQIKAYLEQEGVSPDIISNLDAFLASQQQGPGEEAAPPPAGDEAGGEGFPGQQEDNEMDVRGSEENKLTEDEDEEEKKEDDTAEDDIVPSEQDDLLIRRPGNGNGAKDGKFMTRDAMDKAIKIAQDRAVRNQRAIRDAERFVRPWVGDLAMDASSAADVYRATLKMLGVSGYDKMHRDALRPVLEAQPRPTQQIARDRAVRIAQDGKDAGSFESRWGDTTKNVRILQ
jgi:hypothetical protein